MVGGQVFDIESENKQLSLSQLQALHAGKTGALIRVAVQIGALFGDAKLDAETYVLLTEFATRIGLAFQIIDDVLDVTQSTETLGKPAKSDEKAKKSTYTSLLGVEQAKISGGGSALTEALSMLVQGRPQAQTFWKNWRGPSSCAITESASRDSATLQTHPVQ